MNIYSPVNKASKMSFLRTKRYIIQVQIQRIVSPFRLASNVNKSHSYVELVLACSDVYFFLCFTKEINSRHLYADQTDITNVSV